MLLEDMMTRKFATLQSESTLREAVRLLRNSQRDGLPILNSDGTLAGIFTKTNLYDVLLKNIDMGDTISGYYNPNVVKISKDLSYDEVIDAVRRIPVGTGVVVDREDKVVGLFTKVELITALFKEERLLNTRLNAMYQAMHNALISIDEKCQINFINRAAEQLFSLDHEEAEGKRLTDILPGLDMGRVLEDGIVEIGMNYSIHETKTVVNKTPLIDNGRVIGAIAIFQDLTELELIAEEMSTVKRLNQTLRTVLDIGYDALVVVDEMGKIVLVNRIFLDFIRLEENSVMSRPVNEILENSRLHVVSKTGIPEINDIQFIDGKPYVVSRLPIVRDGQVIGAVGKISFRRVDELRELAGKLETMNSRLTHFQEELKKERFQKHPYTFDDIITINPAMQRLLREAQQAAQGLSTVLISGESGVGKELLAQAIHQAGLRQNAPFIKVNCAAIPENLLETEFFGYAPGAFTGAHKNGKKGRLDLADGGTLFLDEIGDMPLTLQGKLLRVLQDQAFERIGGTSTIRVDIRFIAATNQRLEEKVNAGTFRKDLYFRLNVIPLPIPPLRERVEDILPLVHAFLRKYNLIFGMQVSDITEDALSVLRAYSWPGNIRELENVVERAMNFTGEDTIRVEHLPPQIRAGSEIQRSEPLNNKEDPPIPDYRWKRDEQERDMISRALQQSGGNKSRAARTLGMSRSWLYEKMDKLGIK
ncbi:MAG: sigma 54-interacting transcriptional regulator [Bacillota bacterium]|nr:sigma 54-interacting transcriptional regulator [Bacillota bacterium]